MKQSLTFEWNTGSAADNMTRVFRMLGIPYEHTMFGIRAGITEDGAMVPVTYYRIEGNIYGVAEKPQSTRTFFGVSSETLMLDKGGGYTKEDCMLLDRSPDAHPFCNTLLDALEKAERYAETGYDDIHILERINNRFAVIAHG